MRVTQNPWIRRLVAVFVSSGILGLGATPAATDPVPVLEAPVRVWRVGDRIGRVDRRAVHVRVLPVRADAPLPAGIRAQSSQAIEVESDEECLGVGPEGARRSSLTVRRLQVLQDGVVSFAWKGAVGVLEVAPGSAPKVTPEASLPTPIVEWLRARFAGPGSAGDVVPELLRGLKVNGAAAAGELSREDFFASPAFRPTASDARGVWMRVRGPVGWVALRGTATSPSKGPGAGFGERSPEWVVGGRVRGRFACAMLSGFRLPASIAVWSSVVAGVVDLDGHLLAVEVRDITEHEVSADSRVLESSDVSPQAAKALPLVVRLRGEHVTAGECMATGVASSGTTVLTATHAVAGMRRLSVEAPGQDPIRVDAVWVPDPRFDVCLVRLASPLGRVPAPLSWSRESVRAREDLGVLAPGREGVLYPARIASERVMADASRFALARCLAPPGSSGAPLLDGGGRLTGIVVQGSRDFVVEVEAPSWCFDGGAATREPHWDPVPAPDRPGRDAACALRLNAQAHAAWTTGPPMDWNAVERVGACLDFDSERAYLFDAWGLDRGLAGDWAAAAHGQARADALQPRLNQVREDMSQVDVWEGLRAWAAMAPDQAVASARAASAKRPLDGSARVAFALALKEAGDPAWSGAQTLDGAGTPTPEESVEIIEALLETGLDGRARTLAERFEAGSKEALPLTAWIGVEQQLRGDGPILPEQFTPELAKLGAHPLLAHRGIELAVLLAMREGKDAEAARLGKGLDPRHIGRGTAAVLGYVHQKLGDEIEAARWVRLGFEASPWDPTLLEYASRLRGASTPGADPYAQILEFANRPAARR